MTKRETLTFKPNYKYKMDKEELQNHLHAMRTGSAVHKDKSKYNRRDKYHKKHSTEVKKRRKLDENVI